MGTKHRALTLQDLGVLLLSPPTKPVNWSTRLTKGLIERGLLERAPESPPDVKPGAVRTTNAGEEVLRDLMKGRT